MVSAVLQPGGEAATALYIVAFSLFIIGLKRGTHPTSAKQGNLIAAAGMAVAVVTTLLLDGMGNWGLIVIGLAGRLGDRLHRLGPGPDDRDAADGRPLQRRRRRCRGADRLVGAAPRDLHRRRHPARRADSDPARRGDRLGLLLGIEHRLRQASGPDPDQAARGAGSAGDQRPAGGRDPGRLRRPRDQQRRPVAGPLHRDPDRRRDPRQSRRAADRRRRHAGRDLAAERLHRPLRRRRGICAGERRPDRRRHPGRLLGNDPDDGDGDGDEPLRQQHPLLRLRRRPGGDGRQTRSSDRTSRSAPRTRRSSSPTPTPS